MERKPQTIIATKLKTLGEAVEFTATVRRRMWKGISDKREEIRK
jgi:hypothetical protein